MTTSILLRSWVARAFLYVCESFLGCLTGFLPSWSAETVQTSSVCHSRGSTAALIHRQVVDNATRAWDRHAVSELSRSSSSHGTGMPGRNERMISRSSTGNAASAVVLGFVYAEVAVLAATDGFAKWPTVALVAASCAGGSPLARFFGGML